MRGRLRGDFPRELRHLSTRAAARQGRRSFPARASATTEAALMTRGASQLYLSLGETDASESTIVRFYYKPFVMCIWLGAVVMAFGGALSFSDRRLRVGAPKPAKYWGGLRPAE
jgi:cytochrome c-type biogenesis protein CcmF